MTPAATAIGAVELDVIPIEDDGWRVSIHGADRSNPFALLGFVTHTAEGFEVCVIGRPGDAVVASTLDQAVDVLRPAPGEVEDILGGIRH